MGSLLRKKLFNSLKLSGFNVRREFCDLIITQFEEEQTDLSNSKTFNECIVNLCASLEKQNIHDRSIEKEHILKALEECLHLGSDRNETIFNVIGAFDFPRLEYNLDKKRYDISKKKSKIISEPVSKAQLFLDRYHSILERVQRNFKNKLTDPKDKLNLQTVDYLLTISNVKLNKILILGSLLQVSEGIFYLEDPTGIVELDLKHAKYTGGLFVENIFVLVNGLYEDKKLTVSNMIMPPGEEYENSKKSFGTINYFGGKSVLPLRESSILREHLRKNPNNIFIFSDLWLDHPETFEKLEILFDGIDDNPPTAFVIMGNFLSEAHTSEKRSVLKTLFTKLGILIQKHYSITEQSHFIFIPGLLDPCIPCIVPSLGLPDCITEEIRKVVPKAVFTTNPCRIQYCDKEIIAFRGDILVKLMQGALKKPGKDEIAKCVTTTIIGQGHLSPVSLNALPVHWDFDYTLKIHPLPNLIIVGDKSETYQGTYMGSQVCNPGSFCESGFQFLSYDPIEEKLEECVI